MEINSNNRIFSKGADMLKKVYLVMWNDSGAFCFSAYSVLSLGFGVLQGINTALRTNSLA